MIAVAARSTWGVQPLLSLDEEVAWLRATRRNRNAGVLRPPLNERAIETRRHAPRMIATRHPRSPRLEQLPGLRRAPGALTSPRRTRDPAVQRADRKSL